MPLIEIDSVVKGYGGLRPLRLRGLRVDAGEAVAIHGPDRAAAAVITDLLTGTTLPDEGEVRISGLPTASIAGPDEWMAFLDRFGLVNDRVVLLDQLTLAQNLAVPHTLDLDPIPPEVVPVVARAADEVGLERAALDTPLASVSPLARLRVRLGRALAHAPAILVLEHPTADLDARGVAALSALLRRIRAARRLALVIVTADDRARRLGGARALAWRPATGGLAQAGFLGRWLSSR